MCRRRNTFLGIGLLQLLLTLVAHQTGGAQLYGDGWLFTATTHVGVMGQNGVATTLFQRPQVQPSSAVMRADNRAVCVIVNQGVQPSEILEFDLSGQVISSVSMPGSFTANRLAIDQDGDYIVSAYDAVLRSGVLLRVRPGGVITTMTPIGLLKDIEIDRQTGDLLILRALRSSMDLLRVSPSGGSVTTIAGFDIASQLAYDPRTDGILVGRSSLNPSLPRILSRVTRAGVVTGLFTVSFTIEGLALDRINRPTQSIVVTMFGGQMHKIDLASRAGGPLGNSTAQWDSVVPYRGRNVGTTKRAAGQWRVDIDFPREAGATYMLAPSLIGPRPGVGLSNGRTIPLVPDFTTALALQGSLAPILRNNVGVLDGAGHAVAEIDTRSAPGLAGTAIWLVAVTTGNGRIWTISDPWFLRL